MPCSSAVQLLHNLLGLINCRIQWECTQFGLAHKPEWVVTLLVNNLPYAVGQAGKLGAAKEAAAEMMLAKLGKSYTPRATELWGAVARDPLT